jgi:5'(3')-deoxyribonucleotidase
VQSVRILSQDPHIETFVLSSYLSDSTYARFEKTEWLKEYLPEIDALHRLFVPCGIPKALVVPHRPSHQLTAYDVLLDDYTKNLLEWRLYGGTGIKILNGINHTKKTWDGNCVQTPEELFEVISKIEETLKITD